MKKLGVGVLTFLLVVCTMFASACRSIEFKIQFIVDDSVYAIVNTNGDERIRMPDDPEKEDYIFDGWYWDKGVWQQPFTANSLLDAPLSSNMAVYAKWTTIEDLAGTQADFDTFEKTGEYEYFLKVPNTQETLSLSALVSVSANSSWVLTTDVYGNQTIASRTASLSVGDNIYYVLVRAGNDSIQLYTLNIRRKPIYNVVFDTVGGTSVQTQQVEEDSFAEAPQTTKEGYEFSAWNYDFTTPITNNITIVASWTPNTYTISLNPNGGSLSNATIEATYGEVCALPTPTKTGYMLVGWNTEEDGSGNSYSDTEGALNLTSEKGAIVELYAQWTERVVTATLADILAPDLSYTVTFDLNGASGTAPAPQTVTKTVAISYPTNPTRSGYAFTGWYTSSACTSIYDFSGTITSNMVLYAGWERCSIANNGWNVSDNLLESTNKTSDSTSSYKITVPCAVTVSFSYKVSSEQNYDCLYIKKNDNILISTSGNKDYTSYSINLLAGEYLTFEYSKDGSVSNGSDCAYISGLTINPNISYEGTAKADGVSFVTEQITYGKNFTLSVPTKDGYSFAGWYDGIGGTGTQYTDETGASVRTWDKEEDVTFYAQWQAGRYTITFDANNGNGSQGSVTVTYGEEMPEITVMPTREGYVFIGYYDAQIGGTKYYDADLNSVNSWEYASNATLYAHWQGSPYYVSFNANNGTGTMETQEFEYGITSNLYNNEFTRIGYNFAGWNTQADGSGTAYEENGSVLNLTSESGATIELFAQWEAKKVDVTLSDLSRLSPSYTVTFDLNGASATAPAPQTVTETVGLTYPIVPAISGYLFAGWYETSNCTGSPYDFTADVTEDITLYAKWQSYSGYGTLSVGSNSGSITFPARNPNNYRYYAFIPLVSGSVAIYSTSSSDTYGYLFNASRTQIAYNDDGGDNTNFRITYSVTAGQLYYIVACAYSDTSSCTGTIYISGTSKPTAGGVANGITVVTEKLTYGQDFTLSVPTKNGCSFLGWYDGFGGTGTQYTDETGASVRAWDKEEVITLYAKWDVAVSTITFDKQGGIGGTHSVSATYGEQMPEAIAPTKNEYTFMGYFTAISGGTKYYNADMTSAKVCDFVEDITLYAQWSETSCVVIFDNQGGNGESLVVIENGSTLPTISKPTKTGYNFLGYYDSVVGGTQYYDEDAESIVTEPITESITLYAQWDAKIVSATLADLSTTNASYTVTFDLNGASGTAPTPQIVTETTGLTYPTVPLNTGYAFAGWYENSSCTGSPYDFTADVTENITLYAKWVAMISSYYSREYVDIVNYNAYSVKKSINAYSSSSSNYYYFTCYKAGNYQFYASHSSGDFYITLYNVTKNSYIINGYNLYGSYPNKNASFTADAGDVIYLKVWKYSNSSSTGYGSFYVSGANYPTAGGVANGVTIVTAQLTYGQGFTLGVPMKSGYSFLGWYDEFGGTGTQYTDETGASVRNWDKEQNVTLYAKWEENDLGDSTFGTDVWNGTIALSFAGGSGTSSNPYIIETGAELAYLASRVNNGTSYSGYYFRLDNNIDLNNINWTPIGKGNLTDGDDYTAYAFSGTFDGNGKSITNLKVNTTDFKKAGLFGAINNASITKISITNADVYISQSNIVSGAILTGTMNNSTITQCFVDGEVEVIDVASGTGLCANAGAIVGRVSGTCRIENCLAQASVSGKMTSDWNAYAGGIAGTAYDGNLTISKCAFIGTVNADGYDCGYAGGILGLKSSLTTYINNSFAVANVSSSDYANAIVPPWQDAYPNVSNTYYSSNVTSSQGTSTSTANFKSQSWLTSTLGWDFTDVWTFVAGNDYPVLKAFNN